VTLRVMHLLNSFQIGGAETVALNLARAMDYRRFKPAACSLTGPGPMADRFREMGIDVCHLDGPAALDARRLGLLARLARLLRRERIDVLHCHNTLPIFYGALAGQLAGVGAVVGTRHSLSTTRRFSRRWLLENAAASLVSHYIAVSRTVLESAAASGSIPRRKASVIYNGVDIDSYVPAPETGKKAYGTVVIGCVARLSPEKCHSDLIHAVKLLLDQGRDVRLDLVGDGSLRRQLEDQVSGLRLIKHVRFLGSRDDVAALLRAFDVFALASRFEGLPLTVLEAMAAGLPVVVTRVGSLHEAVEEERNGFIVPSEQPAQLAAALDKLVVDPSLRSRMGAAGRRMCEERFSLAAVAEQHQDLYERLLHAKGRIRKGSSH